jgi:hypothetical protein
VRVRAVQKARGRIASPEYSPRSASCNCWKKRASRTLRWSERPAIARRPKLSALFFEHESRFRSCSCHLGEPPPLTVDSSRTIPKRQGSAIRELPLRHQDACAIGTMLSAGIGGRMPGAFLACLPWLLPDNPQKVFIEVPSAFGAGSKIGCFGPASFCVFGEKRRPGKGRFLAAQATLQDEKTGVK